MKRPYRPRLWRQRGNPGLISAWADGTSLAGSKKSFTALSSRGRCCFHVMATGGIAPLNHRLMALTPTGVIPRQNLEEKSFTSLHLLSRERGARSYSFSSGERGLGGAGFSGLAAALRRAFSIFS